MSEQSKRITLSRFFHDNVRLVADMCPRCYEECTDVQIIGVNVTFLKETSRLSEHEKKQLVFKFCQLTSEDDAQFFGFTQQDLKVSLEHLRKMNEIVNIEEEIVKKMEVFDDNNKNNYSFFGFSVNDIKQSCTDYEKVMKSCNQIENQIYRRASLRIIKNICKRRGKRTKENSKYFPHTKKELCKSKYFTSPQVDDKSSVYFKVKTEKTEEILIKNNVDNLEDCRNVKPEPTDFESKYFKSLDDQIYPTINDAYKFWVPPRSPHNLIEEVLYRDSWALLIATIFLNRTTCMTARPYVFWFLAENPNPLKVLDKYPEELEKYFINLGLQKTRAVQVWRMSHDFVFKNWSKVSELYGIGSYGENAFRMFCLGDFNLEPKDRFLKIYKAWYQKIQMKMEPT